MQIKEKQLMKNTFVVSIGKICTQLITFLLLPLYTTVLSTAEYGIVDLMYTMVSLLLPIVTLQMEQAIFRFLIDRRSNVDEQKELISTALLIVLSQIGIFVVIFMIISPFVHNEYKLYLGINLIANILSTLLLQISRGLGNNLRYSIASFLSGAVSVILNVVFIVGLNLGAYGMLLATFLGNMTCAMYIFFSMKIYRYIKFKLFNKELAEKLLKYSIPLIPNMLSWWIVNASDRSIISMIMGIGANGIYSAANKFSIVITTLYSVFNLTWTESASLYIESEDASDFFSKIFNLIIQLFGCVCLGVIAFMPFVFSILINEKFGEAFWQIPILLVGVMFNILVSFLGSIYVAKKITGEIAKTSIFAAIINIIVNLLLIKHIGLFAASISTAVAYFTMFIYRYIDSKKYITLTLERKATILIVISYVVTIVSYYINSFILSIGIAVYISILSIVINRKSLQFLLGLVKLKKAKQHQG